MVAGVHLYMLISTRGDISISKGELELNKDMAGLTDFSDVQVPRDKPMTRSQYDRARIHWPTQFHEDKRFAMTYKIIQFDGVELFS